MARAPISPSKQPWLTLRDRELIGELMRSTVMTRDQIQSLGYFHSICRLNARLRLLVSEGFVRRVEGTRLGTRQTLYACGPAAAPLISLETGRGLAEVEQRLRRSPGLLFLEHTLRITDIRIALLRASVQLGWSLSFWLSEAQCFHDYSLGLRRYVLKPDGFARLTTPSGPQDLFVEADCGNVSLRRFADKIRAYEQYQQLGVFEETYRNDSFSVLTVTTGCERARHLQRLAEKSDIALHVQTFGPESLAAKLTEILLGSTEREKGL